MITRRSLLSALIVGPVAAAHTPRIWTFDGVDPYLTSGSFWQVTPADEASFDEMARILRATYQRRTELLTELLLAEPNTLGQGHYNETGWWKWVDGQGYVKVSG